MTARLSISNRRQPEGSRNHGVPRAYPPPRGRTVHAHTAIIARLVTNMQLVAWTSHLSESELFDKELQKYAAQNSITSFVDSVLEYARRRYTKFIFLHLRFLNRHYRACACAPESNAVKARGHRTRSCGSVRKAFVVCA